MPNSKLLSKEVQAALRSLFEDWIPFNRTLGLKVISFEPSGATIQFGMRPDLVGNYTHGILHGGVSAAVLDATAGLSIMTRMAYDSVDDALETRTARFKRLSTIDLRIDYLRPGKGSQFTATGTVLRLGKKVAATRMELVDENGEMIAAGAAAFQVG